jgi:S1-C subfamily serine protease
VPQNYVLGYVWSSLAAAQGDELAVKNRNNAAKRLTSQQLIQAQELAAEIQNKINNPSPPQNIQPSIAEIEKKVAGSGTGFIISRNGYVLTCHHVIKDAKLIKIVVGETQHTAKLIRDDPHNDLALLKIDGMFTALAFSSQRSAKMGQEVFTIGFPNPALQGVSAKFSKGTINSLSGFQDDLRLYQISIPVQPGNSGGALLDNDGNILGVIVAMLDAKTTFKITGSLPQSVNYAIKGIYAQAMLDTVPEVADKLIPPSKSKINAVDRVKESTVMVLSY